jgi:hypothetical protein
VGGIGEMQAGDIEAAKGGGNHMILRPQTLYRHSNLSQPRSESVGKGAPAAKLK